MDPAFPNDFMRPFCIQITSEMDYIRMKNMVQFGQFIPPDNIYEEWVKENCDDPTQKRVKRRILEREQKKKKDDGKRNKN